MFAILVPSVQPAAKGAGCVYVCVAKIASFFHERYLVVFACKAVFAQKNLSLKILQKKVIFKGGYLARSCKNLARSFKKMHPL